MINTLPIVCTYHAGTAVFRSTRTASPTIEFYVDDSFYDTSDKIKWFTDTILYTKCTIDATAVNNSSSPLRSVGMYVVLSSLPYDPLCRERPPCRERYNQCYCVWVYIQYLLLCHIFTSLSQNMNYERESKRNKDEGTTVSCWVPYLICECISNFNPCLLTNIYYCICNDIYEWQGNLTEKRERRDNYDTVRCVCYVYSIVYCTTSSTSHISDIFNYLCCRSGGWGDMSMYV